ncbi:MAG: hypothetical protein JW730_22215 [Anaerolineales bacterium]|nr:hypothetical protein [Anaerolineales bacterium]
MIKKITLTLFILLLLTSCMQSPEETPTSTPVPPATSTLPPTPTSDPATPTSAAPACKDTAVLIADVTYPDNAHVTAGEKFTKTWKFQNTGGCPWTGYTVAFVSGDRMEARDSVPVPETEPKASVEVSVDLIAPADDGSYTANFELRNAQGRSIPVGTESTFWVKIIVGEAEDPLGVRGRIGNCEYTENPELVQAMIDLVNKTRAEEGRKPVIVNDKLTTAAQAHSLDMACNSTKSLLHLGSDGSYTGQRLAKVGYTNSYYFELLGVGFPQDAMTEWRRHEITWPAVIDTYVTQLGVGYVYSKASRYGGYWTVILGATE